MPFYICFGFALSLLLLCQLFKINCTDALLSIPGNLLHTVLCLTITFGYNFIPIQLVPHLLTCAESRDQVSEEEQLHEDRKTKLK